MPDNHKFISLTNFLKDKKKINFTTQVEKLGVERHRFDSWRTGRVEAPTWVMDELLKMFPEYKTEIADTFDKVQEPNAIYNQGGTLNELVQTQKKLIDRIEEENKKLREENQKLSGENRALKEIISKRS